MPEVSSAQTNVREKPDQFDEFILPGDENMGIFEGGRQHDNVKQLMQEIEDDEKEDIFKSKIEQRKFGPAHVLPRTPHRPKEVTIGASDPMTFLKDAEFKRKI